VGDAREYDGQLVIEQFADDGAEYRFVPDRPPTPRAGGISLLVALGPGLSGAGLPVVTRLRELLALVRDDIGPRLFRTSSRPCRPASWCCAVVPCVVPMLVPGLVPICRRRGAIGSAPDL
jgi:hypothetical protein